MLKAKEKKIEASEIEKLERKAAIFDELMEFIEDKGLGYLMKEAEGEENISLDMANEHFL